MEDSERRSSRPVRVTRRLLIITWLWGFASLFAIGAILYHLFRKRKGFILNRTEGPEGE
jgi:hypothetical protein